MNNGDYYPRFLLWQIKVRGIVRRIMPHPKHHTDDVEIVSLDLPLDRETLSWLSRISRDDTDAAEKVASILKMIREDDEASHSTIH